MYELKQYQFVKESRDILFEYCKTIAPQDFVNENSSFGRGGSLRNLLVHIANTYEFWIANTALKKNVMYAEYGANENILDIIELFKHVDNFMSEFLETIETPNSEIECKINGMKKMVEPFKLFSHVITHEYHHKGQILSLSRHLGYIPVDTDIMR
ncbi:DinB family protein [Pedobacter insulae]|uniref:Uncharacterized damage-inducible protein DinB (Forms a four-helix bundle) n=1 Tax=Pedobacter insulae TaxID=414048 RepID=A0A1I2Y4J7_9SPHI|nr:DinB family protein [Pedobacter insulae]SFH20650.1 Uncharacterized damage-inducible protein DinB (forms a four-helix bundle) [Pedobacter insulae]